MPKASWRYSSTDELLVGSVFTINARLAFGTSGRYGCTPVLSRVIKRNKNTSYFVAVPLPVRLDNNAATSVGFGVQVGIGF